MAASIQHPKLHITLRCGNLSPKTSVAELVALFSREPITIEDIKMKKGEVNQTSSALVTFKTMEDAKVALEKYNYWNLHGREMILMIYTPLSTLPEEANLFVKNVPKSFSNKKLHEVFTPFGAIVSCRLSVDSTGESRGYGFVQFEDVESADKAISGLQDTKFEDKTLVISKFDKSFKTQRQSETAVSAGTAFTNVFVKNFPSSLTEEKLRGRLEHYGPIHSVYMPLTEDGEAVGFACVNFERAEDAARAVEDLHGKSIFTDEDGAGCGAPFYIQKAEKRKEREETIKKQMEALSLKGTQSKSNLYISHIPESFTKDEIRGMFERFGTIVSIKLQKSSPDGNKQYGYICFKTPEQASAAYDEMCALLLDDSKIHLSFYKAKSERKNEETGKIGRMIFTLSNIIEKIATEYKKDWDLVKAKNARDFTSIIVRDFFSLDEKELRELTLSSTALDNKIHTMLKSRREKLAAKSPTN